MEPFELTEDAVADIDGIWLYLLARENLDIADRIVEDLFRALRHLARLPAAGHRRGI